jgi:hypothetical protein
MIIPLVLFGLFVLLVADALRWKVLVQRELKRRNLVRVPSRTIMSDNLESGLVWRSPLGGAGLCRRISR